MASSKTSNNSFSALLSKNKQLPAAAAEASSNEPGKVPPAKKPKETKQQLGTLILPSTNIKLERTWRKAGFKSKAEFVEKAILGLVHQYPYHEQPLDHEE